MCDATGVHASGSATALESVGKLMA